MVLFYFSKTCLWCNRLWYCVKNKIYRSTTKICFSPNKKKILEKLKTRNAVIRKKFQDMLNRISHSNLQNIIDNTNIPKSQKDLNYEILNASKTKNPKNRRYSDNWMILCLLFQNRFYTFII